MWVVGLFYSVVSVGNVRAPSRNESGLLLMTEAPYTYNGSSCYMEKLRSTPVMGLRSSASICVGFGKQTFYPSFLRLGTYSTVEY